MIVWAQPMENTAIKKKAKYVFHLVHDLLEFRLPVRLSTFFKKKEMSNFIFGFVFIFILAQELLSICELLWKNHVLMDHNYTNSVGFYLFK
jgi:hypothetical protein